MRVVYSPLDALTIAKENPGSASGVLRDRIRDHRAGQRHDRLSGQSPGYRELLPTRLARSGPAGDGRDHGFARVPRAGISGGRACVQCDGNVGVPGAGREVQGPDRRHRIRAAGSAGGHQRRRCCSWNRVDTRSKMLTPVPSPRRATPQRKRCSRMCSAVSDRTWRGIGSIPDSGWQLAPKYAYFDAEERFSVTDIHTDESSVCRSGEVLQGLIKPHECSAFGKECTPRNPLGATMVSSEGACAAYYLYRRLELQEAGHAG